MATSTAHDPFSAHAQDVLREVRESLSNLLASVGADPAEPQSLARRFKLHKSLTWKIGKVICEHDPWMAAVHLPGPAGLNTFVSALQREGASEQAAQAVHHAAAEFQRLIDTHSSDRETLEIMAGSVSSGVARATGESVRKLGFQANSAAWGVRALAQLSAHFVAPNAHKKEMLDLGVVCGFINFQRLRHDATWPVATRRSLHDDGTNRLESIEPMDSGTSHDGAPILRAFCSDPMPELRAARSANGTTRFEFTEGPIGKTAAATCSLGWIARALFPIHATPDDQYGEHIVHLITPVEVVYHDLFVHRSLGFALNPTTHLYSALPGGPAYPEDGRERGLLPLPEKTINLGATSVAVSMPESPRYNRMLDLAAERMGHSIADFHAFRLCIRYPTIPTLALHRYRLPER